MKKHKLNNEKLEVIKNLFENALWELDENEIYHDETVFHDIMSDGSHGIIWHLDIEFDDLPSKVIEVLEDFHCEVWNSFDTANEMEEFIEQFLEEYYV